MTPLLAVSSFVLLIAALRHGELRGDLLPLSLALAAVAWALQP